MKHRVAGKKLNRDTNNRKALFKGLITSLIEAGEIKTTETKAKAIKGLTDKLINRAQDGSLAARRLLGRFFGRRDIVNQLVDTVAPATKGRTSGFTRIVRLGKRRGDNTMMVKIELVDKPTVGSEKPESTAKEVKKVEAPKAEAPAKKATKTKKTSTA